MEQCWRRVEDPFVAVGSGRDYAMAVMALGHDATRAVEIAARFDPGTGNGVDGMRLVVEAVKLVA